MVMLIKRTETIHSLKTQSPAFVWILLFLDIFKEWSLHLSKVYFSVFLFLKCSFLLHPLSSSIPPFLLSFFLFLKMYPHNMRFSGINDGRIRAFSFSFYCFRNLIFSSKFLHRYILRRWTLRNYFEVGETALWRSPGWPFRRWKFSCQHIHGSSQPSVI